MRGNVENMEMYLWHCFTVQTYSPRGMLRNPKITILENEMTASARPAPSQWVLQQILNVYQLFLDQKGAISALKPSCFSSARLLQNITCFQP